jgi:DNA topoisomerase-1
VRAAVEQASRRLGNTPTVTRSSYVDPRIVDAWQDGELARLRIPDPADPDGPPTPAEERAVLRVLARRARADRPRRARADRRDRPHRARSAAMGSQPGVKTT